MLSSYEKSIQTMTAVRMARIGLKIGDRVRIYAKREHGSAVALNGLEADIVADHPIAPGWFKIRLEANSRTEHLDWSIAADSLVKL